MGGVLCSAMASSRADTPLLIKNLFKFFFSRIAFERCCFDFLSLHKAHSGAYVTQCKERKAK